MAWHRHITGDVRHVWPDDDQIGHTTNDENCVCGPLINVYQRSNRPDLRIVIHNALDKAIDQ